LNLLLFNARDEMPSSIAISKVTRNFCVPEFSDQLFAKHPFTIGIANNHARSLPFSPRRKTQTPIKTKPTESHFRVSSSPW
jgi:hypothetical protein